MTDTLTIDLGGTQLRAAVVREDGTIVERRSIPTPATERPTALVDLVRDLRADHGDLDGLVVGVPGIIDHHERRLVAAPNIPQTWIPLLSADWIGAETGLRVGMANDADLAAVGEWAHGAGQAYDDVAYVTISTGIGAGMVVGDRLVRGRFSGGELGHTIIDRAAAAAGEPATVELLGAGRPLALAAAAAGLPSGAALVDLVRAGDEAATALWNRHLDVAALGIVNLCWLVAPEAVVIGGGVGRNEDLVAPMVRDRLATVGPRTGRAIDVVTAALGDDAGLVGGAAWFGVVGGDT